MLLAVMGFVAFKGLKFLQAPENLGYQDAEITAVEIEKRVGMKGYDYTVTLSDGAQVHVRNSEWRPDREVGGKVCLRRIRDRVHNREWYEFGMYYHCAPNKGRLWSWWA